MGSNKINYGIDLGTTNSSICRMEKGEPVIKKTDTLKDTMPSCVSVTKKGSIKVGDSAYNDMKSDKRRATRSWEKETSNTYLGFKRTMGTDKVYYSSNLDRSFSSEELSAEVLKTLKSFILDENLTSVVITVPAKFTVNQKDATIKAAKLAGFSQCELLQEPIAAAMAYGLKSSSDKAYWMVFDFGGGTFDVALIKVEEGVIQVFDTEGDNYLGGNNIDYAIIDSIIIPYLEDNYQIDDILHDPESKEVLRDAMKTYAEDLKNQLSFKSSEDIISNLGDLGDDDNGDEVELDITVTQEELNEVMRPIFQKAVDLCIDLLKRNNLSGEQLEKLILVGGPTHAPLLRKMLKEQVTKNIDTSIDPMTAVAVGAALFASTKSLTSGISNEVISPDSVKFDLKYEATSIEQIEFVAVKLNPKNYKHKSVMVEITRSDKSWSSSRTEINSQGDVIEVSLQLNKPNSFEINCFDAQGNRINCTPNEFTIIQGTKVGSVPLPYHIGISIQDKVDFKEIFLPMKGLEKNKPLPAVGIVNDRKTNSILRPGIRSDRVEIPVYQVDDDPKEERSSKLYEYVADVVITGEEVKKEIPRDSPVDVTLKVDSSEMMTMELYFPAQDITIKKILDTSKHQSLSDASETIPKFLDEAKEKLSYLSKLGIACGSLPNELESVKQEFENSSEKKAVLQQAKRVLRKIEDIENENKNKRLILRDKLKSVFKDIDEIVAKQNIHQFDEDIRSLKSQINKAASSNDTKTMKTLLGKASGLRFAINRPAALLSIFVEFKQHPNEAWANPAQAKWLLQRAEEEINSSDTNFNNLHLTLIQLIELLKGKYRLEGQGFLK